MFGSIILSFICLLIALRSDFAIKNALAFVAIGGFCFFIAFLYGLNFDEKMADIFYFKSSSVFVNAAVFCGCAFIVSSVIGVINCGIRKFFE